MTYKLLVIIGLGISGCAISDPDEREYDRVVEYENWRVCMEAYRRASAPTTHRDHSSSRGLDQHRPGSGAIQDDLAANRCRAVLGKYWIDK